MNSLPMTLRSKLIFMVCNLSILIVLFLAYPPNAMAVSVGCDDAFVQLNANTVVISVAATGVDDTANIQCALDVAITGGYPTVKLGVATYFISSLLATNFRGSLEGTTKTSTTVEILDHSIDCFAMSSAGMQSAAIKFVEGEPRVRFMTIRADQPCMTNGKRLRILLHFTGESRLADNCDNDVIFGSVDRVIIDGTSQDTGPNVSLKVSAESNQGNGVLCKDTLLGTFKLNRSEILNSRFGISTSMQAGAQVDINFNEFSNVEFAIQIFNSNQNTTITGNQFMGDNPAAINFVGIEILTLAGAPAKSRVVVHNNKFHLDSFSHTLSRTAIDSPGTGVIANISLLVTNNLFELNGPWTRGIWIRGISNGHVSANRFTGSGSEPLTLGGSAPITDWTITANTGFASYEAANPGDIKLQSNTSGCIVGAGQGAIVSDFGTDNTVLTQ